MLQSGTPRLFLDAAAARAYPRVAWLFRSRSWMFQETLLPVLLTEGHHKRGVSLGRIAQLLSSNPARLMGLKDSST